MSSKIFGAYDIRGEYPKSINEGAVRIIARALSQYFGKGDSKSKKIIVGKDARLSSPKLHQALRRELAKNKKLKLIDIGRATTPMFCFLVRRLRTAGGVMVTASHNPKSWNGLKVIGREGDMISGLEVLRLIQRQ